MGSSGLSRLGWNWRWRMCMAKANGDCRRGLLARKRNGEAMMMFLENPQHEISRHLTEATQIRIAVAYWGKGAAERLGIKKLRNRDIRIVCDLLSGACNPDEVQKLIKVLGADRVRKLGRLHAKAWIIDKRAFVGSSNASSNGLAEDGREADALIEANVLIEDRSFLATIGQWYETTIWKAATAISDNDIKVARARWKIQYGTRPPPQQSTLLGALKADPSVMDGKDVWVYVWPIEDLDKAGKDAHRKEQEIRGNKEIECWDVTDEAERDLPPPGAHIIEFDTHDRIPRLEGIYRILQEDHIARRNGRELLLCKKVKTIDGLRLGNRDTWETSVARAIRTRSDRRFLGDISKFFRDV